MIIRLVPLILGLGISAMALAATELPSDTRLIFQANVRPILLGFKEGTEDTIFLTGLDPADQLVQGAVDLGIVSGTNPCFMPLPDGRILLADNSTLPAHSTLRAVAADGSIEDVTPTDCVDSPHAAATSTIAATSPIQCRVHVEKIRFKLIELVRSRYAAGSLSLGWVSLVCESPGCQ